MYSYYLKHALKKDYRVTKVHHCIPLVLFYPFCCQHLIKKEVKTISEQKHPNVFGIKELLKTDNTENKEDYSENSKKLKDISNTDKETKQTNVLDNKEPLKTDKTENISDNTKKELKDISNTDK